MSDSVASTNLRSTLARTLTIVDTNDHNKKQPNKKRALLAGLPADILELLGSFVAGFEEVGTVRSQLPSLVHDSVSNAIEDILRHATTIKISSNLQYSKSEHNLYQAHLCFAATTDVGRMMFDTSRTLLTPDVLTRSVAYHAAQSPPAALFKRLKSVYDRIQRMKMLVSDGTDLSDESGSTSYVVPVPHTANLTVVDINALLTDIDNQFELVQRMITFLRSEISSMEAVNDSHRNTTRRTIAQHESIESALDGLSLAERGSHQSLEEATDDGSVSLIHQSASYESLNPQGTCSLRRQTKKKESNVWTGLRNAVKQTKRPNYSFEIYEQMMDSRASEARGAPHDTQDQLGERAAMYRHYSSAYRALKGSHRLHRDENSYDVHNAVEAAVSNYQRAEVTIAAPVSGQSVPKSGAAGSSAQIPDAKKRLSSIRSPFVTSPAWKLAADSPGDWRHIQEYADRSRTAAAPATQPYTKPAAKASTSFSAAGDKGYVSPLVGILEHINKYPERLPKAPAMVPRPAAVSISTSADTSTSETAYAPSLLRRERNNKLVDSPDTTPRARSSSKDAERALFAPQMGGFAGAALGSTRQAASGGDSFGSMFGSSLPGSSAADRTSGMLGLGSDGAKKAVKSTIAPTVLSPPTAPATSPAATRTSAAQVPAVPTTVPDIAQRVREIYAAAVPEKLSDVPKLLVKYAGKETELMEKVIKKYGNIPPAPATNKSPSAGPQSPVRKSSLSAHEATSADRKGSGSFGSDAPINIRKSSLGTPTEASAGAGTGLFGLSSGAAGGLAGAITPTSLFSPGKSHGTGFGAGSAGVGGATTPTAAGTATATPTPFGGGGTSSLFGKAGGITGTAAATPAAAPAVGSTAATGWGAGGASSLFGKPAASTAAAPAAGTTTPQPVPGSVEDVLRKVQAIYSQHNPSKLSEIPQLMEKYKGKELQLIANLEKKYGPTPAAAAASSVPAQPTSVFGGAATATPSTGFGSTGFGAGAGGAGGTSSLFGGKPSTGFGQAGAPSTAPAVSGFASPFAGAGAAKTPSPFGASAAGAGAVTPSPFGAPSAVAIPSPFGNAAPSAASAGIGSLFGGGKAAGASPGTGFGQSATAGAAPSAGTGGLFGGTSALNRGSAGVAGNASPFGSSAQPAAGGGGLFGNSSATGGAGTSPFSSGYSTPLGKAGAGAGAGGSIFQQPAAGGPAAPNMGGGTGFGQPAGGMLGGTTSPSVFGNRSAAPASGSLFGGGAGAGTSTGFGGGMGQTSSLFGSGHAAQPGQGPGQGQHGHGAALNSVQDVYQRVHAIYSTHNPSKLTEIPHLMEKYKGQELQLVANLEKKYNINSAQMGNTAPSAGFGGGFGGASGGAASSSIFGQGSTAAAPSNGFGASAGTTGGSLFGRPSPSGAANPAGSSLFGNSSSSGGAISGAGGGGGLFGGTSAFGGGGMGATAGATPFAGMQTQQPSTGTGMGQGSVFGSTTRLGGNATSTGFGSTFGGGGGGGGSLFGGGAANANSMWGNR